MQGLQPAQAPPLICDRRVVQEPLEDVFVIALQSHERGRERVAHQAIEHAPGIRTAVDIIAERHGQTFVNRLGFEVAANLLDHAIEKIRSSVNIADRVDASWYGERRI
jgi:hypothetical protein